MIYLFILLHLIIFLTPFVTLIKWYLVKPIDAVNEKEMEKSIVINNIREQKIMQSKINIMIALLYEVINFTLLYFIIY